MLNFVDIKKGNFCVSKILCMEQTWKNNMFWSYIKEKRPDHGIYYITDGFCEYVMSNGEKHLRKSGDVMYIPKGANYEVCSKSPLGAYLINFNVLTADGDEAAFSDGIKMLYSDKDGVLAGMFENITSMYFKNRILNVKSIFYSIISYIADGSADENVSAIHNGIKYIEENFNREITVGELAKMCAVSETTFRRIFKNTTGESPVKYINRLRISKSKELLKSSGITVDEIAYCLGFYDKSYFCKTFKSITNMTPAAYRRSYLN